MGHAEKCTERGKKDGRLREIEVEQSILQRQYWSSESETSQENAEIEITLCFERDLIDVRD